MARSPSIARSQGAKSPLSSTLRLALWRLRQTWKLLLVTGLGIVAAVMFVCAVPLYTDVAMTAGLRGALTSSPQSADIVVQSTSALVDAGTIGRATQQLNAIFQKNLGPYLAPSQLSIQTQELPILGPPCAKGPPTSHETCDLVKLLSFPMDQTGPHLTLTAGRLPQPASDAIEIALTAESAGQLKATVGSIITTNIAFFANPAFVHATAKRVAQNVNLHVVGIFNNPPAKDPFWHASTFLSSARGTNVPGNIYTGLTSSQGTLSFLSRLSNEPAVSGSALELPVTLSWYYPLEPSRIAVYNLDDVSTNVYNVQVDTVNTSSLNRGPFFANTKVNLPSDILAQYKNRIPVAQIPSMGLLFLVLGLVLFFVSMMADLLVERQVDTIAILQVILPVSLAIILGMLIAICVVAVAMMVGVVSQPSMNATLRLNED